MTPIEHKCDNCGASPAPYEKENRDICPTDRGNEVREYREHFCHECVEEFGLLEKESK